MRRAASLAAALAAAVLLYIAAQPGGSPLSPASTEWDGLSLLCTTTPGCTVTRGEAPPAGAVLVAPLAGPPPEELVEAVEGHLAAGGVVVLLDEDGYSAAILDELGVPARVSPGPVIDYIENDGAPWAPLARVDAPWGSGVVALNYAGYVEYRRGAVEAIARTSPYSFIDSNGDGRLQANETVGPIVVGVQARVGGGLLIVFSDASLFINGLYPRNSWVLASIAGGAPVALDVSAVPLTPADEAKIALHALLGPAAPGVAAGLLAVAAGVAGYEAAAWLGGVRPVHRRAGPRGG